MSDEEAVELLSARVGAIAQLPEADQREVALMLLRCDYMPAYEYVAART